MIKKFIFCTGIIVLYSSIGAVTRWWFEKSVVSGIIIGACIGLFFLGILLLFRKVDPPEKTENV